MMARCCNFYRAAADFLEILDLTEETDEDRAALEALQRRAMEIARKA